MAVSKPKNVVRALISVIRTPYTVVRILCRENRQTGAVLLFFENNLVLGGYVFLFVCLYYQGCKNRDGRREEYKEAQAR